VCVKLLITPDSAKTLVKHLVFGPRPRHESKINLNYWFCQFLWSPDFIYQIKSNQIKHVYFRQGPYEHIEHFG